MKALLLGASIVLSFWASFMGFNVFVVIIFCLIEVTQFFLITLLVECCDVLLLQYLPNKRYWTQGYGKHGQRGCQTELKNLKAVSLLVLMLLLNSIIN